MDPTGKAGRIARSRQACVGCKATKQRCDGITRIPCRRCELYGLECTYMPSTGPAASKPSSSAPRPLPSPLPPAPRPSDMTDRSVLPAHSDGTEADEYVVNSLLEISERLRSIESTLSGVHISPVSHPPHPSHASTSSSHSSPRNLPPIGPYEIALGSGPVPGIPHPEQMENLSASAQVLAPNNPVEIVNDTISLIDRRGSSGGESAASLAEAEGRRAMLGLQVQSPDAILRGVLTPNECDEYFTMFFDKLAPWVMHFDIVKDASSSAVRERSPILWHVILLSTAYYLMENSDQGLQVYCTLVAIVNELLAPIIISAQSEQLSCAHADLIRSLSCLLLWKPIQFSSLQSHTLVQAENVSKLNGTSSLVLGGIIFRTAGAISLPAVTTTFARACSALTKDVVAVDPAIIGDLRLWYWLCVIDSHGGITTGRSAQLDISQALRTTRLFASLNSQPHDLRLVAYVELFGTAKGAISEYGLVGKGGMRGSELKVFNTGMDTFEEYWTELLEAKTEVAMGGMRDKWATDVLYVFGAFVRVVVNASVYTRWLTDRKPPSPTSSHVPSPSLTTEDLSFLQRAIASAEQMLFALSLESRSDHNMHIRRVRWRGGTGKLTLDREGAACFEGAIDTVICVMYIFVAVFLAKVANTGLMTSSLILNTQPSASPRLEPGSKLASLLLLASEFLDEIAPTDSHPARRHASILRRILDGGAGATRQARPFEPQPLPTTTTFDPIPRPSLYIPPPDQSFRPVSLPSGFRDPNAVGRYEGLGNVLGTLSPSFYEEIGFFDGMDLDLAVDWASLGGQNAEFRVV